MKKSLTYFVVVIVMALVVGMLIQRYVFQAGKFTDTPTLKTKARKILYWVAPMDPNYRRDKPGKSPMGMDLIPVYEDQQTQAGDTIKISPQVVNNLGVRTAVVKRQDLARMIDTVGYVTVNEDQIEHVHTYTSGWIRKLFVNKTGELVRQGQLLAEIYSPTLVNAQEEYLLALKNQNAALIRAGEKKLLTLGVSQRQITTIKEMRKATALIKLFATQGGIVSELNIREGMFVKPEQNLMALSNLSPIWIIAEVFERQANWVNEKQPAIATLASFPGKTWQGEVDYVYPELDPKARTLQVRLIFPNPDLTLKPHMYAHIKIFAKSLKNVLAIPREALIRTGQGDRVIVALGDGQFRAQPVTVGIESGQSIVVLSGLKEGDKVVTSAQFLIDSESNLQASQERISQPAPQQQNSKPQSSIQEWIGMGVVKLVDLSKREITLAHRAIPELNMPAMTMGFPVVSAVDLDTVKTGDEIHFVLRRNEAGRYQIVKIHVMKSTSEKHPEQSSMKGMSHD